MLVDEFQHAPELLDAVKAELNRDLRRSAVFAHMGRVGPTLSYWLEVGGRSCAPPCKSLPQTLSCRMASTCPRRWGLATGDGAGRR